MAEPTLNPSSLTTVGKGSRGVPLVETLQRDPGNEIKSVLEFQPCPCSANDSESKNMSHRTTLKIGIHINRQFFLSVLGDG